MEKADGAVVTADAAVETADGAVETAEEATKTTIALETGGVQVKMDCCSEESVALAANKEEGCSSSAIELSLS